VSDKVAKELSLRRGIGIRYGCHCAHMLVKHILGVPPSLSDPETYCNSISAAQISWRSRVSFVTDPLMRKLIPLLEVLTKIAGKKQNIISEGNRKSRLMIS